MIDLQNRLTEIIKRLKAGEDPELVKQDARELLSSLDPQDLTVAEEQLVEAGLEPEDLRHLCSIHMEMLAGEVEKLKEQTGPGHVLHTLVEEHEHILATLDELERVNQAVQQMDSYDPNRDEFDRLKNAAHHLVEAESHHEREEEVLFPEAEKHGIWGPPQVMRMEHTQLRQRKHDLKELAENAGEMDFETFKKKLDTTSKFILLTLRDHIFKENNILYPAALQSIEDEATWNDLKAKCDSIGYCCFTPEAKKQ
mgnify:CR=1 FL=1